jgi:hypothetical protein
MDTTLNVGVSLNAYLLNIYVQFRIRISAAETVSLSKVTQRCGYSAWFIKNIVEI